MKSEISQIDKNTKLWLRLMGLGERLGCHQMPERSFFIKGWQMPVCARCTGVYIGKLCADIAALRGKKMPGIAVLGCVCILVDWGLQHKKILPSTNSRRLCTGILGGFGVRMIEVMLFIRIISCCKEMREKGDAR